MLIVINAGVIFKKNFTTEHRQFFTHCLALLSGEKRQVEFCFLTDQYLSKKWIPEAPATTMMVRKILPGSLGSAFWSQWQVPSSIHTRKADLYLGIGTPGPKRLGIPQCVWFFGDGKDGAGQKKIIQSGARPASVLLSGFFKNNPGLLKRFALPNEKITMVPLASDESYQPLPWTEKENIKVKYAGGKEYFISRIYFEEAQLIGLLKAFSLFKKRQQSNMQLLFTGMKGDQNRISYERLENYKFRHDVHVYPGLSAIEFMKTTASAYALLQPGEDFDGNGMLNAFQAQVPVISGAHEPPANLAGSAVLFAAIQDHEQFADQMMLLFKDEAMRNELIRKGKIKAREFSMQQSVRMLWKGMMRAMDIGSND
jgi:hypothetical protein